MPTSYTSLLGLALPVTGELSGTWGDTVNDYITQYLDASVAGTQTISGSQTAVTLSKTTATSLSQAGSGATGSSQYNIINCTGNPASMLTVTVPAASKTYVVVNATSTNQDVKIVGAGPTTGVTLVAGEKAVIAWNGSDFIKIATSTADGVTTLSFGSTGLTPSTATPGAVTVAGTLVAANGGTGQSTYTTGDLLYATGSTALSKLGIGTNGQILTSTGTAPQWSTLSGVAVTTFSAGTTGFTPSSATSGAVTLAGTLATTNGGTGLTSFTANGVVYASSTSALTTGSALSFNGTRFTTYVTSDTNTNIARFGVVNTAITDDAFLDISADAANNLITLNSTGNNAGSFAFQTGGSEQMRLTSTGLGIGTSSWSTSKLYVLGNTTNYAITSEAPNGYAALNLKQTSGNTMSLGMASNGLFIYDNNAGTTRLTLDSSGNLGIGTSSPAAKLTVLDTTANAATALVRLLGQNSYNLDIQSVTNGAGTVGNRYNFDIGSGGGEFSFSNSGGERMRLDSSGNLGLGVTPSAWSASYKAISVGYAGGQQMAGSTANTQSLWTANLVFTGTGATGWKLPNNVAGTTYEQYLGAHKWYNAPANGVNGDATLTQAMTLDASGNLGVGTTSPLERLDVVSATANRSRIRCSGANEAVWLFQNSNTGTNTNDGLYLGIVGAMDAYLWNYENNPLIFGTNNTERARITNVGNFSLGTHADRGTTVGTNAIQIFNGTAPAGTLTNGVSLYSSSGDLNFMNSAGNGFRVGYRNLPPVGTQTGSYTLAAGDVGKYVQVSTGGSITIPTSVFSEGDAISIYNNTTGSITITCSAPTAYIAGTNTVKTSMTLATRGVATILFYSATACVVSGNVT